MLKNPFERDRIPPVPTSFSQGLWDAARRETLLLQYCKQTGKAQFYPRPVSMMTGRADIEWRPASGLGKIYSFTITHHAPPPYTKREPYVVALVELEEGVRIIGNIINCAIEDVRIGAAVRVCWLVAGDEKFPAFEPATP